MPRRGRRSGGGRGVGDDEGGAGAGARAGVAVTRAMAALEAQEGVLRGMGREIAEDSETLVRAFAAASASAAAGSSSASSSAAASASAAGGGGGQQEDMDGEEWVQDTLAQLQKRLRESVRVRRKQERITQLNVQQVVNDEMQEILRAREEREEGDDEEEGENARENGAAAMAAAELPRARAAVNGVLQEAKAWDMTRDADVVDAVHEMTVAGDELDEDEELRATTERVTERMVRCPFTQQIMQDPVRNNPCGHVFSREGYLAAQKQRGGRQVRCPAFGCKYTVTQRSIEHDHAKAELIRKFHAEQEQMEQDKGHATDDDEDDEEEYGMTQL